MVTVKLEFFLFSLISICRTVLSLPINVLLCYFLCIFRALWLVSSTATGAPQPFYNTCKGKVGACAHGEINAILFALFLSYLTSVSNEFGYI